MGYKLIRPPSHGAGRSPLRKARSHLGGWWRRSLIPTLPPVLVALLMGLVQAGDPPRALAIPKAPDAHVVIDGRLDEPEWSEGAVLRDFSQYLPNDNRPADDSTTVLVWYSQTAIYLGIKAYE